MATLLDTKQGIIIRQNTNLSDGGILTRPHDTGMPLYYFNIYNDDITLDEEGVELADDHAAHAFAVKAVRSLAADTVLHGHLVGNHRIEYVDKDQNPLGEVLFNQAVEITP